MRPLIVALPAVLLAALALSCGSREEDPCETNFEFVPQVDVWFLELSPWEDRVVTWRLDDGCGVGDHQFTVRNDDHHADLDVHAGTDLTLEAWIDLDADGAYDAPPTDASWRVLGHYTFVDPRIELLAIATPQVDLGGW